METASAVGRLKLGCTGLALWALLPVLLFSWGAHGAEPAHGALGERYAVRTSKPYQDVVADAAYAMAEHNFRITGRNTIGEAIAERLDRSYPGHTVLEFCNLQYAQRLLDVDSHYLLFMPCRLAISEQRGEVIVATYLLPEEEAAAKEVNAILKAIVQSAAE